MKVIAGSWEPTSTILSVDTVTKENSTSLMHSLGWGTAGLVALGPLGLVAGAVVGASRSSTILSVKYHNGKQALVQCKTKELKTLMGAAFNQTSFKKPSKVTLKVIPLCMVGVFGWLYLMTLADKANPSQQPVVAPIATTTAQTTTPTTTVVNNHKTSKAIPKSK